MGTATDNARPFLSAMARVVMHKLPKNSPSGEWGPGYYHRPDFQIMQKNVPEVGDWQTGREVKLVITAKVTGLRDDEEGLRADVEVVKIGVDPTK